MPRAAPAIRMRCATGAKIIARGKEEGQRGSVHKTTATGSASIRSFVVMSRKDIREEDKGYGYRWIRQG